VATSTQFVSVGYEGREVNELASELRARGVDTLIDVRLNAISRRRGFSKNALRQSLEVCGIEYRHVQKLGNPKANRDGFRRGFDQAVRNYERVLDESTAFLNDLAQEIAGKVVAVLCVEADHTQCHRRMVIDRLRSCLTKSTHSRASV
jgi:uncharacterized protein (DUF488 family)